MHERLVPSQSALCQAFLQGHLGDSEREVDKLTACLKTAEARNMQTTTMKGVSLHGLGVSLHGLDPSGEVYPVGDRECEFAAAEGPG